MMSGNSEFDLNKTSPLQSILFQSRTTELTDTKWAGYTLEFQREAVRLVEGGKSRHIPSMLERGAEQPYRGSRAEKQLCKV